MASKSEPPVELSVVMFGGRSLSADVEVDGPGTSVVVVGGKKSIPSELQVDT